MKQIGLSVPATANQRDPQRPFIVGGKESWFRGRQREGTGSACLQETPSRHVSALSFCFWDVDSETRLSATPKPHRVNSGAPLHTVTGAQDFRASVAARKCAASGWGFYA